MNSDLRELYQEVILDHSKAPRNFRFPDGANREAQGDNPLCGDNLTVKLILDGDTIVDIGFQGSGKLAVFAGVAEFPMRVKCATLSWHTMQHAIKNDGELVSTE